MHFRDRSDCHLIAFAPSCFLSGCCRKLRQQSILYPKLHWSTRSQTFRGHTSCELMLREYERCTFFRSPKMRSWQQKLFEGAFRGWPREAHYQCYRIVFDLQVQACQTLHDAFQSCLLYLWCLGLLWPTHAACLQIRTLTSKTRTVLDDFVAQINPFKLQNAADTLGQSGPDSGLSGIERQLHRNSMKVPKRPCLTWNSLLAELFCPQGPWTSSSWDGLHRPASVQRSHCRASSFGRLQWDRRELRKSWIKAAPKPAQTDIFPLESSSVTWMRLR